MVEPPIPSETAGRNQWLLRRADQMGVAGLVLLALVSLAGYWLTRGGHRGQLIEIDRQPAREIRFEVDVNQADWPELAQLPGIGETLARRIVESREANGPYRDLSELERVQGIGDRVVERIRPYVQPLSDGGGIAEP